MLKLEQALLVEGKYDAARLSNIVDGTILTTDGFRVFKDGALQRLLKRIAAAQGLIILTDSDAAGFKIRHFVTGLVARSMSCRPTSRRLRQGVTQGRARQGGTARRRGRIRRFDCTGP